MINQKVKQIMEMTSIKHNITLNDAEKYIIAMVSVGLSLNNEMRKDITSIYNQNKLMYSERAKSFSGYNHIIINNGDLEQEIYAKKTLGILLGAEESNLIKGKILRLIKKHYKDIYICAQNNNYDRFRKNLLAIEDSDKRFRLIEMLMILYFYTMKQVNVDFITIEVAENVCMLASMFYNIHPLSADIQSELKKEKDRLADVKQIVQKELGLIKNSSDIIYNNSKELKHIINYLRNLLMIDKIDLDLIASKVDQDDLDKVMLAFLKTKEISEIDKNQVLQSIVTGFIVKILLNKYARARELYFTHSEENLYYELKVLREKLHSALLEKNNVENLVQRLRNEIANYELKLKEALSKLSKVYEAQISKLNREIERLKINRDTEMKNRQELSQLREFFFNLKNDYLPTETSLELSRVIVNKKLMIIGGTPDWRKRLKDRFPTILTIDGFNDKIEFRSFGEIDFVLFYSGYMSHKTYYKIVDFLRENDIPAGYIGKTNMDLVEFEIVEEINKRLTAH